MTSEVYLRAIAAAARAWDLYPLVAAPAGPTTKTTFGTALVFVADAANEAGAKRPTASSATTMAALRRLTRRALSVWGQKPTLADSLAPYLFDLIPCLSGTCLGTLLVHRRTRSAPRTIERMANRLAGETSPYLLQHANNPVDWFPWGRDALARAKLLDRPIFLSIGYAACHWCHVMERESFEHEPTARYLNDRFVAIKVDREERPDLDQVYMSAVQAMTGGGGWPMSVFLTPEGRPFYGGTYYPDEPRHGMPSFRQVLEGVARAWREQRDELESAGSRLVSTIVEQQRTEVAGAADDPSPELLTAARDGIFGGFDRVNGGWGRAPKFPQPMTVEFLLRR